MLGTGMDCGELTLMGDSEVMARLEPTRSQRPRRMFDKLSSEGALRGIDDQCVVAR